MPRRKTSTPTPAAYAALMARLAAVLGFMTAQGKSRPTLEAPEGTIRLVRALLTDLRRFATGLGHKRTIPALPHGPVKFSTLLLVLGEAKARLETLGLEHGFPYADPRSLKGRIDAANTDMAALLASATASFRRRRQQRMDEEERETQWGE
ncbi:hypothetical protein [Pelagibacterium sp.]|uniref:hypothetical protein n=1 Tax=Pelagibacterium sp. TaxID=1967288 RepID=UPI003A9195AD